MKVFSLFDLLLVVIVVVIDDVALPLDPSILQACYIAQLYSSSFMCVCVCVCVCVCI